MKGKPIIIFDGICNLCNFAVDFILKRDKREVFVFVASQKEAGKKIIAKLGLKDSDIESLYLVEDQKIYHKSTAILRILKRLSFPWNLGYVFIVIPRPIRDFVYNIIAKNRYRWFGKRETCRLPIEEEKGRFLL